MNLVKMFMKQRTLSTSSNDLPSSNNTTTHDGPSIEDYHRSTRYRKKSMNDSGKCSTLSQHVLDEEEDETPLDQHHHHHHLHMRLMPDADDCYQLDSLDVVASAPPPQSSTTADATATVHRNQDGLRDKRSSAVILERQNQSKSIQTSNRFMQPERVIVFPECRLPNLDFVHLEHDVLTSQFVSGEQQYNQLNGSHPHGFEHIVDWDSLLFLLSREHKEMLKRYPMLSERIRNSYQDSVADVFDEFPETIDVNFDNGNVCDCDSLLSSTASNNSSNRYSSDSGLGPNTYNFEDLRKLFVYEYTALDEESEGPSKVQGRPKKPERKYRERRYTMCSMEPEKPEKRVSFEAGLPKRRTNKSTSSIPRLITSKTAPKCADNKTREPRVVSKIPKLIKSPSKSNMKLLL